MPQSKLLDQVRTTTALRHQSPRTIEAYTHWIRRLILFHHKEHPLDMGAPEVHAFQTHLAQILKVLASTQNQALNPVAFLYHQVPKREPGEIDELPRARRLKDLPVVLSPAEVQKLLSNLTRTEHLLASLLYGSGLHLSKCVSLRAKDLDLDGRTTMNHTHVLAKGVLAIRSPLHELELPVWGRPPYAPSVVDVTSPQQKSGTWPDAANIAADQWVPEPKSPPSLESPDGSHLASGCS